MGRRDSALLSAASFDPSNPQVRQGLCVGVQGKVREGARNVQGVQGNKVGKEGPRCCRRRSLLPKRPTGWAGEHVWGSLMCRWGRTTCGSL